MYIGGKEINRHASKKKGLGSGPAGKQAVIGLRERGGRFEAKAIEAADKPIVQDMIKEYVETGSTVYTDDHRSYSGLAKKDYRHKSVKHSADKYAREVVHTNGIESVWSVIKRGFMGVYTTSGA